ncbi:MAG: DMT family transporter [Cyanobacteria bacterium P01_F01_bin.42]
MTLSKLDRQISGRVYLMIAIAILGAASAATRKLTDLGAENLIDGRNPISFCNVLFVGNLCALALLGLLYYRDWTPATLRKISLKDWLIMTVVAIIGAAIVPTLVFVALGLTAVNNVILIGQIDAPLILALSVFFLGDRVNPWIIVGAAISFVGVSLTVLLQPPGADAISMAPGIAIGRGELLTLIAAIGKAVSNLISKISLKQIPLSIFSIYRTIIGTIVFFITVLVLFSPSHFVDVASPFLWQWMLFYSAIIVVGGQFFWFSGLKRSSAGEISLATAFNPIVGVLAAFFLLGELPTTAQYIGGAVILIGIVFNQIGVQKLNAAERNRQACPMAMAESLPYRGV